MFDDFPSRSTGPPRPGIYAKRVVVGCQKGQRREALSSGLLGRVAHCGNVEELQRNCAMVSESHYQIVSSEQQGRPVTT